MSKKVLNGLGGTGSGSESDSGPYLLIEIQPQEKFRFRYTSESQSPQTEKRQRPLQERSQFGTQHGCLRGKCCDPDSDRKIEGHPTVQLVKYYGKARIKCELVQYDNDVEHPYKLGKGFDAHQFSHVVPERGNYTVRFSGMAIISIPKTKIAKWLENKLREKCDNYGNSISKELRNALVMENIKLNKVRLKFTAHDVETDQEICDAVYSDPICDSKCPATNDLKIVKMSHYSGSSSGGTTILMFVSKVNKNDIEIWFYEESDSGKIGWCARADFLPVEVHYQYGISFGTPRYENPRAERDVKVFVQLLRPSDGATSKPVEFLYTADPVSKGTKKRKPSPGSYDFSNIEALRNVTVSQHNTNLTGCTDFLTSNESMPSPSGLLHDTMWCPNTFDTPSTSMRPSSSSTHLNSATFTDDIFSDEMSYDLFGNKFVSDSGRGKGSQSEPATSSLQGKEENPDYTACFTPDEGAEVKELIKQLCDVMRNKKDRTKQDVRNIMERLFDIRLSNGDTFLHMALHNNITSFEYIVKLIHSVQMKLILDLANNKKQTILHLAVVKNMPDTVELLVAKGCNPMLKDHEGNNAVHYAVRSQACLEVLLNAIKKNDVVADLNACNYDKKSPLHLAAIYDSGSCARALLQHGASCNVRDTHGRTPLHLAAYDDKLHCARALLHAITPEDIDVVDGYGNTALQIVCGVTMRQNTREIVEILLEKKADPWKHEDINEPAWNLVRNKPELYNILKRHDSSRVHQDVSDDEFVSAEEFDAEDRIII